MLFTILLNISAWLLQIFGIVRVSGYIYAEPEGWAALFNVDKFWSNFTYAVAGVGAIGLSVLLLRASINPIYAILVWAVGVFIEPISNFLLAIPNMIDALIPAELNPIAPLPNPFSVLFGAMFAFGAFMFLMELVTQTRQS